MQRFTGNPAYQNSTYSSPRPIGIELASKTAALNVRMTTAQGNKDASKWLRVIFWGEAWQVVTLYDSSLDRPAAAVEDQMICARTQEFHC